MPYIKCALVSHWCTAWITKHLLVDLFVCLALNLFMQRKTPVTLKNMFQPVTEPDHCEFTFDISDSPVRYSSTPTKISKARLKRAFCYSIVFLLSIFYFSTEMEH
jgi:hypothetical protein